MNSSLAPLPSSNLLFDISAENLVDLVAERTYRAVVHAWQNAADTGSAREPHIVITGGRTGLAIAKALDRSLHRGISSTPAFASKRLHIWFSDERFVGGDSEDRSDSVLMAGFTRAAAICTFHRVALPGTCTLEEAAARYAADLDASLRDEEGPGHFDVTILSLGEDGHIASLFPGQSAVLNSANSAVAVDNSPKPPPSRVSIGVARLAASKAIYIFAVGESKREPLSQILDGSSTGPVAALRSHFQSNQLYLATDIRI